MEQPKTARIRHTAAVFAFLASRVLYLVAVHANQRDNPLGQNPDQPSVFPNFLWFHGWTRWDGGWYLSIALSGYSYAPDRASNVAFFPGYPLIVNTLALPLRHFLPPNQAYFATGIVFSLLCFGVALWFLFDLALKILGHEAAIWTVCLLAFYPFSYFYGAAYTESFFLMFAVMAFWFACDQRWGWACLVAGLASGIRPTGIFVGAALGVSYLASRGFKPSRVDRQILWFLLAPLGLALYFSFLTWRFGSPLVFFASESAPGWGHHWALPALGELWSMASGQIEVRPEAQAMYIWYVALLAAVPILLVLIFKKLGPGFGVFSILSVASFVFSGTLISTGRYLSVVFPLFMVLGSLWKKRAPYLIACAVFAYYGVMFAVSFARGSVPI